MWFVLRKTARYWKGAPLQFVFTCKFKEVVSLSSRVSFQNLGIVGLMPSLHLQRSVAKVKWLGRFKWSVMESSFDFHFSLDSMFSTNLPKHSAKRSALTQPHGLFLYNMPSKCLSNLGFNSTLGGSGCLHEIISYLNNSLALIILIFQQNPPSL